MLLLMTALLSADATPSCAALHLEPPEVCVQTPLGVVISDDAALATRFAAVAAAAEARHRTHFRRTPTPYAVIIGEMINPLTPDGVLGSSSGALQDRLREAGARHVLPWFTEAQRAALTATATRTAVEAELRARGLEGEALRVAVDERLQMSAASAPSAANQDSAAGHELGHMWAIEAYWPRSTSTSTSTAGSGPSSVHYGGPAPDWFDESAAVLMEDEAMAQGRRDGFAAEWRKPGGVRPAPLADYFVDPHPLARPATNARSPEAAAGRPGPSPQTVVGADGVVRLPNGSTLDLNNLPPGAVITTPDGRPMRPQDLAGAAVNVSPLADRPSGDRAARTISAARGVAFTDDAEKAEALIFYAQARLLADFLIERSGDAGLYARIARALASGDTMDAWLASEGRTMGLGGSVAELETAWLAWLTQVYGAAGPTA